MKQVIFLCLMFLSSIITAQKVIILNVNQPPEFGFSIGITDTTVVRGASVEMGTDITVFGGTGEYHYHWEPTESLSDSNVVNPIATLTDTTNFILTVTDSRGCSFSVAYTINVREKAVDAAQVKDFSSLQAVLYPNPNMGIFQVKITGKAAPKIELFLYSETGQLIHRQNVLHFTGEHTETFRLNNVSGHYNLQIVSGDEKISRQFIIH